MVENATPPSGNGGVVRESYARSDLRDVRSLRALLALDNLELDPVALGEGLEATPLNGAEVNEDVRPPFAGDETVALGVIKPLHGASETSHETYLLQEAVVLDPARDRHSTALET